MGETKTYRINDHDRKVPIGHVAVIFRAFFAPKGAGIHDGLVEPASLLDDDSARLNERPLALDLGGFRIYCVKIEPNS